MFGFSAVAAMELTPENWDSATAGKTVFVKFFAPWCGHCKGMKPAWDKLMKNWNKGDRAKTSLIADVDCTAEGKPICDNAGVKGFPTIKWGDPADLQDYDGGRDYEALKTFAKDSLKPMCSPSNLDLCDADKKKEIESLQTLALSDLEAKVDEKKKLVADAEAHFEVTVKKLQEDYQKLQDDKDKAIKDVKESGLGLMSAVLTARKKAENITDEKKEKEEL